MGLRTKRRWPGAAALAAAALVLAACGGDSGDAGPASPPPGACDTPGTTHARHSKAPAAAGQPGGAAIASCAGAIDSPQWTQTAGPAVELLAAKSQAIAFETPAPGRYAFRVDFRDAAGASRSDDFAFDVAQAANTGGEATLALRLSQAVRMGGAVSVRAWPAPPAGDTVASIAWVQTEGPPVTLDTRDSHVAHFVAPDVARDTPIRLRATLTTGSGRTASDDVLVLVERHAQASPADSSALWRNEHVSRVHAFKEASPFAAALARCAYDTTLSTATLCPLATLPFLAQTSGGALPSVEQVMDRVVVSHDWMGRNFETFLRTFDTQGDFRRMLMSTTAVVIGAQVRPSFYYAVTGAIYLDADNFWLTPGERDTVNEAPDFRSSFGATLQYTTLWRYVRGNTSLFPFYDPRQRLTRGTGALLDEAGWLLLHELAHALDFLPASVYASLSPALSPWGNIAPRVQPPRLTSDAVAANHPLTSTVMSGLGQVRFFGAPASAAQEGYTAAEVAAFFAADLATDDYAYASLREDTAMALEEFLMQRRLGLKRDFAIAPRPASGSSPLVVQWGQRGRIGEPALRPRLRFIVTQLAPWIDPAEVDRLDAPLAMRPGDTWSGNLVLPGPTPPAAGNSPLRAKAEPTLGELWQAEQAQRRRTRLQPASRALPGAFAPAP
ncbi:MAG: hypothetical protein JNL85_03805 [Rubrivivax sp.]|nr:hypothetical protein [Rubrivivax sp.]